MHPESPHRLFERQVERIHRLLEPTEAAVTWNDRVPDPDNPKQQRQIDVTIRRDGHLTLVECRDHKAPQDVQWVEELIGRRSSLLADAVIAVSTSGFTEGARRKAQARGVFLRTFAELTDEEIRQWGATSEFSVVNYEFLDVRLSVLLPVAPASHPEITGRDARAVSWVSVLRDIAEKYDIGKARGAFFNFKAKLPELRVNGAAPLATNFTGRLRSVETKYSAPTVMAYSNSLEQNVEARVEQFPVGTNQVIKGPAAAMLVFDLSRIEIQENFVFGYPMFHQTDGLLVTKYSLIGLDSLRLADVPIRCEFLVPSRSAA